MKSDRENEENPESKLKKVSDIIAEYDAEKGIFKRSRTAILDEIFKLSCEARSEQSALEQKGKILNLLDSAFNDFKHQGYRRLWDFSFSQTQIALIKLDFLLNNGNFTRRHYQVSIEDRTILILLAQTNILHQVAKYHDLSNYDLNESQTCGYENTALHWAIMNNSCDSAITLINHEHVDLSIADLDGKNALHMAILKGREHEGSIDDKIQRKIGSGLKSKMNDVVIALLKHKNLGEIINTPMPDGNTPLHLAYMRRDMKLCKKLISLGANEKAVNAAGLLPEGMLVMSSGDVQKYLERYTDKTTTLSILKPNL
jgi:ankyrin repeat protein